MDIEDLFNEQYEESKEAPLVIPEFGPCSIDGAEEEADGHQKKDTCCKKEGKSLACSDLDTKGACCKDEEEKKALAKSTDVITKTLLCFKCKKVPPNFANKQDKVCKVCFLDILVHRFKSSLRQNLKIWKDDLNLVCISGGSNSMALLNMLYFSLFGN